MNKTIWTLRILGFSLLIILALKPVMVRPDPGMPSAWAVLMDTSKSMAVKDPTIRLEQAKSLTAGIIKSFNRIKLFQFSDQVKEITKDDVDTLKPDGNRSDLAKGIKEIFKDNLFRGAIVMTDGRQVGSGDPLSEVAAIGQPMIFVGMGDKTLFRDVIVKRIQSPPFAFKNIETSFSATISVIGFKGKKITVRFKEGRKIVSVQAIEVAQDDTEATVNFNWTPTRLGTRVLSVEAAHYEGEITIKNNRKKFTMDVGRDRFRVLYICGHPGPEYGFLRHQFKADPAVELVTFVILRNASNVVSVPDAELSLIPFPTQDVLIKQMQTFDLIVFEEFSFRNYGLMSGVMQAIRKKVENGGSFLLMGGPAAFGSGSHYAVSGIREMIPVEFGGSDVPTVNQKLSFKPRSLAHPILRLDANSKRNKAIWDQLPLLEGATLIPGVKKGATILGSVSHQGKDYPVLVGWQFKKGRVAALSTRTTWRWSMLGSPVHYQQFWKNMVLWLTQSDQFRQVRVALEPKSLRLGDKGTARVWVFDEYFTPISDVDIKIQLTNPDGETIKLQPYQETTGVFSADVDATEIGEHKIQAWVLRNGKRIGRDRIRFQVLEGHLEEQDLRPDFLLLDEMAQTTGGRFIAADDFSPDVLKEFDEELSQNAGKKVLVWNSPWFFIVLILVLIFEWGVRKRYGYP